MNSHASLISRVGASVLKDIEGLCPQDVGFERKDCCAPLPAKLPGSFESLLHHVFLASSVVPTEWDKTCSNVAGYDTLRVACKKELPQSAATAYYEPSEGTSGSALLFKYDQETRAVHATQYSGEWGADELPWKGKGVIGTDRSRETFIFVCSHRRRDDRCGYCGPMLVDQIRKAINNASATLRETVHVMACSHIGGHVYAGNVLVYNRRGGVCFGCFCPSDVATLVESIENDADAIPDSLVDRVRGQMGPAVAAGGDGASAAQEGSGAGRLSKCSVQ